MRLRVSQDSRLIATRCTLEFWLSVRINVKLHDVLILSSISIDVLDLLSISIDALDLSFPKPQGPLNATLDRPPVIWQPALFKHSCISL